MFLLALATVIAEALELLARWSRVTSSHGSGGTAILAVERDMSGVHELCLERFEMHRAQPAPHPSAVGRALARLRAYLLSATRMLRSMLARFVTPVSAMATRISASISFSTCATPCSPAAPNA